MAAAATTPGPEGVQRIYDRLDGAGGIVERVADAEAKIDKHEAICAVRYDAINSQLWWMRWLMIALLVSTLFEPRAVIQALMKQWGLEVSSVKPEAFQGLQPKGF